MITITKGSDAHYCNACRDGVAVAEVTFRKGNSKFGTVISLCRDCLSQLDDVSRQANIAIERAAAARSESEK